VLFSSNTVIIFNSNYNIIFNQTFDIMNQSVRKISCGFNYCSILLINGDAILVAIDNIDKTQFITDKGLCDIESGLNHVMYTDNLSQIEG